MLAGALALAGEDAARLYASLAEAEVRHRDTFLGLARDAAPDSWRHRASELAAVEAAILAAREPVARIH
jgi:tRNA isopentenyl-2-thiomethyl-A-37 hydroxylase MiaE